MYDTDFHAVDYILRRDHALDMKGRKMGKVTIEHDAFIGAGCIILKGVTVGACSIVGAGSVVTKDIPAHQIWAGNPAKFIRNL